MGTRRIGGGRRPEARRRGFSVESLERRALLASASEVFVGPSLSSLITQAEKGKNTTQAQVNLMVGALQTQLQDGPLADLDSGAVDANGFIFEAQALEASYEVDVDLQLAAKFPNTDQLLKLQGQRVIADLVSADQQGSVGLISSSTFDASAGTIIGSLTAGPILAIGTKPAALTASSKAIEAELASLTQALGSSTLTLAQVDSTLNAEAEAYRSEVHAGLQVTQLRVSGETDTVINALELSTINIAQTSPSDASTQLSTAVTAFDSAILGKNGLYASHGALSKSRGVKLNPKATNGQEASTFSAVSGTATLGGTATLTATLTLANGSPLMGESVAFTLDGAFAGVGVTNFHGVATLLGVPTAAAVGTSLGAVVATFASDTNYLSTKADSNFVVAAAPSTISGVSGSAVFGGPGTLQATLTSSTGQALANQTISFNLDGNAVGSAVTNASGVATLAGVSSVDAVGTDSGGVVATFAGAGNFATTASNGNFVVVQATTSLLSVSGSAPIGGTATLTATLFSSGTGRGLSGQTVSFTLGGTSAGTAVTDASGVATLTDVTTTLGDGTHLGAVVASFAGNTNLTASTATGNLTVGQASTALTSVDGTASFGAKAILTATLTSTATSEGLSGQTVSFTLNGNQVGTAVTDSNGVASLSGVTTTAGVGTETGAVVATFAGTANYADSIASGNLVVSQTGTALSGVSGTSSFGGKATLTALLTSSATNGPIAGQIVTFTLQGIVAGSAVTNASGIATLTGVTENDAVGTITDGVVASYGANSTYLAATNSSGNLVITPANTAVSGVSGTASFGGTATLTATLKSAVTNLGLPSEVVAFELNNITVGSAMTDANGLATLTDVTTGALVGNGGSIVASFAGTSSYAISESTGTLVIAQAATKLASVSGTATFGGTATLTATLTSTTTNQPIPGETVTFELGGQSVGTATTDSNGVASLSGAATTAGAGTDTGAVVASFAGLDDYAASSGTGDLVVGKAASALSSVSGTAAFGGTATLTATLKSSVTALGIASEVVTFMLNGTDVGTALTNASGVATLTGVASAATAGTHAGAIVASFVGDSNYSAATTATGDLVVSQAGSALSSVSGTAMLGGTATLSATLKSSVTGLGVGGETVSFTLDSAVVGTAVTNASGVATLTGVATTDAVGTDAGGVVASFAGDSNYSAAANAAGDLVVSKAATALSAVSGTATFGGTATLTATLMSSVTGLGVGGETVSFTLDSAVVGTAVTNASGVATLTGVATTDAVGTDAGGVVASFAGDSNYSATANASGDLVVSKAATALSAVSGTETLGGLTMLTATLTSSVTGLGIAGEFVTFAVRGTAFGVGITGSDGVVNFTGPSTGLGAGTYPGGVVAMFTGDSNYSAAADAAGDLVVSQAGTSLTNVSGTAPVGGPATLMATLTTTTTGQGVVGEMVSFTLDGTVVGTAVTDNSGVATLTGVPTSDPAGTDSGGVVVTFAGDSNFTSSTGSGDLVVS